MLIIDNSYRVVCLFISLIMHRVYFPNFADIASELTKIYIDTNTCFLFSYIFDNYSLLNVHIWRHLSNYVNKKYNKYRHIIPTQDSPTMAILYTCYYWPNIADNVYTCLCVKSGPPWRIYTWRIILKFRKLISNFF